MAINLMELDPRKATTVRQKTEEEKQKVREEKKKAEEEKKKSEKKQDTKKFQANYDQVKKNMNEFDARKAAVVRPKSEEKKAEEKKTEAKKTEEKKAEAKKTEKKAEKKSSSSSFLDNFKKVKANEKEIKAAHDVWRGKYGNGEERKKKLAAAGLDYNKVQGLVNKGVGKWHSAENRARRASETKKAESKTIKREKPAVRTA